MPGAEDTRRPGLRRTSTSSQADSDSTHLWGEPTDAAQRAEFRDLKRASESLAAAIPLVDATNQYKNLVGSGQLAEAPIHRWFAYKEGYSPKLLAAVLDECQLGNTVRVVDPFGGVGTTAIAGLFEPRVVEARSAEYSPLAHFVGKTKLSSVELNPQRLRSLAKDAISYPSRGVASPAPALSSFSDRRIFSTSRLSSLIRARDHITSLPGASDAERDFFMLGLAAVIEDLSGIMKDGRALRIVGQRNRKRTSLATTTTGSHQRSPVKAALHAQWGAMIEDLDGLTAGDCTGTAHHVRGDARSLGDAIFTSGEPAFPDDWADLACFSPPYLNFIDYSEVHKLELWLLRLIETQREFRELRRGTLRSHPSVRFEEAVSPLGDHPELQPCISGLERWMHAHSRRPGDSVIVRQYFEDMYAVFEEQYRTLRPGGHVACVVANSTFSRRLINDDGETLESWRLPVLTDVLLAHIAIAVGFCNVRLLKARNLRPRNTAKGTARESVVLGSKPM